MRVLQFLPRVVKDSFKLLVVSQVLGISLVELLLLLEQLVIVNLMLSFIDILLGVALGVLIRIYIIRS
jgi:hypothetical protein